MLRFFIVLLCLPTFATAQQSVRQFHTQSSTSAAVVIQQLQMQLPDTVEFASDGTEAMIAYNGIAAPLPLVSFLTATFPDLDTAALAPGKPVVASIVVSELGDATSITALIQASFGIKGLTLPAGSDVLMETISGQGCNGQQIASHPTPLSEASPLYRAHIEDAGFTLENPDPNEVSYFIGRSDSCAVILYLQADPNDDDSTLIVLNFSED